MDVILYYNSLTAEPDVSTIHGRVEEVDNHHLHLMFRGPCMVSIFLLIYFQRDATLQSLFISWKLLYIFRVVSPTIIRSTQLYLQYLVLVNRYCYLPLLWGVGAGLSVVWELYRSVLVRPTVMLCRGLEKNGMVVAWHEHGMASVNQTRRHCVNQMGKTHSKPLEARHSRGTAWAWLGHGMLCVNRPLVTLENSW